MERWVGRVALVTGASSGIGAALCESLVRSGMKVVGIARGVEHIKEEDIRNVFDTIKKELGGVDICINNAGLTNGKGILNSTVEELHEVSNVNVIALCLCSQLTILSMRERGVDDGHAVLPRGTKFYAATKFAVRAITEGLRQEMREAKSHIRITSVSPGVVETQFAFRAYGEEKANQFYKSIECLQGHDVANAILHIISSPKHVEINELIIRPTEQSF
ncbi:Dehydrogenase/reductase SDR family member 11 [Armadillidium vulgare]|nr:Dehydrogenase/reductase SDR family member 11 [Armadillidium vulgare]